MFGGGGDVRVGVLSSDLGEDQDSTGSDDRSSKRAERGYDGGGYGEVCERRCTAGGVEKAGRDSLVSSS